MRGSSIDPLPLFFGGLEGFGEEGRRPFLPDRRPTKGLIV